MGNCVSNIGPFQRLRVKHKDIYIYMYLQIHINRFGPYPKGPSGGVLGSMDLGDWKRGKYVAIGHLDPSDEKSNEARHGSFLKQGDPHVDLKIL